MPPVSSAAFQVKPKSLRLIFVVADAPIRIFPQGSLPSGVGPSTFSTTGFVDTVNRQIAGHARLAVAGGRDLRALERDRGVFLRIQKVRAFQMRVATDRRGS